MPVINNIANSMNNIASTVADGTPVTNLFTFQNDTVQMATPSTIDTISKTLVLKTGSATDANSAPMYINTGHSFGRSSGTIYISTGLSYEKTNNSPNGSVNISTGDSNYPGSINLTPGNVYVADPVHPNGNFVPAIRLIPGSFSGNEIIAGHITLEGFINNDIQFIESVTDAINIVSPNVLYVGTSSISLNLPQYPNDNYVIDGYIIKIYNHRSSDMTINSNRTDIKLINGSTVSTYAFPGRIITFIAKNHFWYVLFENQVG